MAGLPWLTKIYSIQITFNLAYFEPNVTKRGVFNFLEMLMSFDNIHTSCLLFFLNKEKYNYFSILVILNFKLINKIFIWKLFYQIKYSKIYVILIYWYLLRIL